jgi:hypothetical protein
MYSGAALLGADERLVIEGVKGEGDDFMKGLSLPERLPQKVFHQVEELNEWASARLGPVHFEWVFDGETVWIVQLHRGSTQSTETVLVPGEAERWISCETSLGLNWFAAAINWLV